MPAKSAPDAAPIQDRLGFKLMDSTAMVKIVFRPSGVHSRERIKTTSHSMPL